MAVYIVPSGCRSGRPPKNLIWCAYLLLIFGSISRRVAT